MDVSQMWDKGVSKVKGAVGNAGIEHLPFVRGFIRLCADGYQQGWHERNGGNASYRLTPSEAQSARSCFVGEPREWVPLGVRAAGLAGEHFLVTGAGKFMRNVAEAPAENIGIVEIDSTGSAYRVVWGLEQGARPTSEFAGHFIMHAVRNSRTAGGDRVIYHCHPAEVVALTKVCKLEPRAMTRLLWKQMTECILVFPEGVGVAPCLVPGSMELGQAAAEQMNTFRAVIAAQHGIFAAGPTFDDAFGLVHVIVKAAQMYRDACIMALSAGGTMKNEISDDDLRNIASAHQLNAPFLEVPDFTC